MASVGIFYPRGVLPFAASSNPSVRHFRQALSLDEHRGKFKAYHWIERLNDMSTSASEMEKRAADHAETNAVAAAIHDRCTEAFGVLEPSQLTKRRIEMITKNRTATRIAGHEQHTHTACKLESTFSSKQAKRDFSTDVLECWFTGAHCGNISLLSTALCIAEDRLWADVGGGAEANATEFQLARIPLVRRSRFKRASPTDDCR